jgi:hypothetical protein
VIIASPVASLAGCGSSRGGHQLRSRRSPNRARGSGCAAAIFQETRDRRTEGIALDELGVALREVERFDEAITARQNAASIFRET